jgi:hypothetical protein
MVKTATNPIEEAAVAARSATQRANQTNGLIDIESAISEWEKALPTVSDEGSSADQADILTSYSSSVLLRWNLTHQLNDIKTVVLNLEAALGTLPHSLAKTRYDLLIRLAQAHESWYLNFKDNSKALKTAIQYWEDAYGLAVILRHTKEAVCSLHFLIPDSLWTNI